MVALPDIFLLKCVKQVSLWNDLVETAEHALLRLEKSGRINDKKFLCERFKGTLSKLCWNICAEHSLTSK